MATSDFRDYTPAELIRVYAEVVAELNRRQIVRTRNAPLGDFVEYLSLQVYGGKLEPNSVKSHDLVDADGRKLQIKARSVQAANATTQFSAFRSWAFEVAVFVVVDDLYRLAWAREVPMQQVKDRARFVRHDNKYIVTTSQMRSLGTDVTAKFREPFGRELAPLATVAPLFEA